MFLKYEFLQYFQTDFRPEGSLFKHNNTDILDFFKPYTNPLTYFDEIAPDLFSPKGTRNLTPNQLLFHKFPTYAQTISISQY